MKNMLTSLAALLRRLAARDCPPDAIEALPRHLRDDLPPYHPRARDRQPC